MPAVSVAEVAWRATHDPTRFHWYMPKSIRWIDRVKGISPSRPEPHPTGSQTPTAPTKSTAAFDKATTTDFNITAECCRPPAWCACGTGCASPAHGHARPRPVGNPPAIDHERVRRHVLFDLLYSNAGLYEPTAFAWEVTVRIYGVGTFSTSTNRYTPTNDASWTR